MNPKMNPITAAIAEAIAAAPGEVKIIVCANDEEIGHARRLYGSENIEIDEPARVSRGSNGAWVQAWVFVPKELLTNYVED